MAETTGREVLAMAIRMLWAVAEERRSPGTLERRLEEEAPWVRGLAEAERKRFLTEFLGTTMTTHPRRDTDRLVRLVDTWKARASSGIPA